MNAASLLYIREVGSSNPTCDISKKVFLYFCFFFFFFITKYVFSLTINLLCKSSQYHFTSRCQEDMIRKTCVKWINLVWTELFKNIGRGQKQCSLMISFLTIIYCMSLPRKNLYTWISMATYHFICCLLQKMHDEEFAAVRRTIVEKNDPAGNRTPISRATVEDTNHCTTESKYKRVCVFIMDQTWIRTTDFWVMSPTRGPLRYLVTISYKLRWSNG